MPHITVTCYPKHLSDAEFSVFIQSLTQLAEKHLHASEGDVSILYTEVPEADWKQEVWDKAIAPNLGRLAKKPGYSL
jgi:4-oxalocrotonate tautomerase